MQRVLDFFGMGDYDRPRLVWLAVALVLMFVAARVLASAEVPGAAILGPAAVVFIVAIVFRVDDARHGRRPGWKRSRPQDDAPSVDEAAS